MEMEFARILRKVINAEKLDINERRMIGLIIKELEHGHEGKRLIEVDM